MHGSGVHLALGCVCQCTVLWSGHAACFLISGRLLRFPSLVLGDTISGRADIISKQNKRRKRKRPVNARQSRIRSS
ncbi:hypothetical protein BC826DRAFT_1086203, partial [Russula brevipes]